MANDLLSVRPDGYASTSTVSPQVGVEILRVSVVRVSVVRNRCMGRQRARESFPEPGNGRGEVYEGRFVPTAGRMILPGETGR